MRRGGPVPNQGVSRTFAALRHRNYRLWFTGQMVSLFGTWMQTTAQGFLVYQLTRSPAFLGYVGFAAGIPIWLFTLYGGVVADRMPRRTLMLITQTIMMGLAFVLAALSFVHIVAPWHILLLAFGLGAANAFDAPARQALVTDLVEREDLTNAIALNATMFNSATIVGPAVAGVTYAAFGPGWCFTLNGISFLAVIAALWMMDLPRHTGQLRATSARADLKEGVSYVISQPVVWTIIGVVAMTSLFGISFGTLVPAWAVNILGGDARTNGLLFSARGAGALGSALLIASLGRFEFKGRLLTLGMFAFPLLLLVFAFMRHLLLSLLALAGVGAATILIMNLANTLVQTQVPDELRGRVMSIYSLTFFGSMPVGALWIGAVAEHFSEPAAVVLASLISLCLAVLVYAREPRLRGLP